ncbi:MAG: HlyD family type I secretion periplasmic adaptor subunit [Kovacikia sp.]
MPTYSVDSQTPTPDSVEINNQASPPRQGQQAKPETDTWFFATHELLDALPQVWTRGLLYLLVGFAAIIIPWTLLSKVDETGSARGRLEPKGRAIRLDAAVTGTVKAIKVKEGESVEAGQVLMELESEVTRADLQQAEARLEGESNRLVQLQLVKKQLEITNRTQRLQNQAQESAQQAQISQIQQQSDFNRSSSTLTQELLAKDEDRVKRFKALSQQGIISGLQAEDAERALIESHQRLRKNQADLQQSQSELEKQLSTYQKTRREGELSLIESEKQLQELQAQIVELQSNITQTRNALKSLQFQLQQRTLQAPIAGTVFQLPIKSAGAVVQPGTLVAQIAPRDVPLVLRAQMSSQQSGFLRIGLPVKVKFDAYPFQDYGIVEGRLSWISPDSKVQETGQGQTEVFELEITVDRPYIQTPTRQIPLTPGQTAAAEVITRQRRVIDFILDPFKKLQEGGLKL